MSLNGDRIVESMEGNVVEKSAWRGCVGCGVWKVWKEGRTVEEEGEDGGRLGRVGKGEERHTAQCILYTPDSDVISTRGFPRACAEDF